MTLHKKAEVLADQLVQAIEGMIHSYDYNGACHRISEALVAFAEEKVKEALKIDDLRVFGESYELDGKIISPLDIYKNAKDIRNAALDEAAKIAENAIEDDEHHFTIAEMIRALKDPK